MSTLNGNTPKSMSIESPDYEGDGRGVIVVTLAAALTTFSIILYSLYRLLKFFRA